MKSLLVAVFVSASAVTFASPTPAPLNDLALVSNPAPEGSGHLNISVSGKVFPPPIVPGQEFPQNLQVDCKSCTATGDLSISGGGEDFGLELVPGTNFTSPFVQAAHFDFSRNWVGFALQSFTAHIELLVQLTPANSSTSNELVIHLLGEPRVIPVPDVPGLLITFDPQIHGVVNVSRAVNFTHGFDLTVPPGATLLIPISHVDEYIAVGFNETKITPTAFESSTGDLEMDFQLSFRPTFSIGVGAKTSAIGQDLEFDAFTDLPKLDVVVSQVKNVTAACAAPPSSQSSGSSDERVFPQLTKLEPRIGMDVGLGFLGKQFTPVDFSAPVGAAMPVECYEYDSARKLLVTPGSLDTDKDKTRSKGGANAAGSSSERPGVLLAVFTAAAALALFA